MMLFLKKKEKLNSTYLYFHKTSVALSNIRQICSRVSQNTCPYEPGLLKTFTPEETTSKHGFVS